MGCVGAEGFGKPALRHSLAWDLVGSDQSLIIRAAPPRRKTVAELGENRLPATGILQQFGCPPGIVLGQWDTGRLGIIEYPLKSTGFVNLPKDRLQI